MRVEWTRRALDPRREIFDYIARDRPHGATQIVDGPFDATDLLGNAPDMGAIWERGSRTDLRFVPFKTYRLIYRVDPDR